MEAYSGLNIIGSTRAEVAYFTITRHHVSMRMPIHLARGRLAIGLNTYKRQQGQRIPCRGVLPRHRESLSLAL